MEIPTKHLALSNYNKQYGHLLGEFLCLYGNITRQTLKKATAIRLSDLDDDSVVISFSLPDIPLPVDKIILYPEEYKGTPESKFNQMLLKTVEKSGKSLLKINTCLGPRTPADLAVLLVVPLPLVCYLYRPLLLWIPIIGNYLSENPNYILWIIGLELLCHLCESLTFIKPLMFRYSIAPDLQVEWYMWGLLEGYSPVRRLNAFAQPKESTLKDTLMNI
ncbi:similar to Saccharomyces cerevisiae YDR476C Putative protein of unknown function [Maudiozyma saulgeensis]|uniref:DUF2470 domain-containing protein n=1 Tax=Maudiozyma saulgeensis TaxID=1789683 RepID=A0A1X7R9G7_9SACH|nr:similar to Saccharomyces cerevisiae YDR476C Putative protein of unknown function [Kazachstania saulgeensis]